MKPEDKVCTSNQSYRLRELGFEIEAQYSWYIAEFEFSPEIISLELTEDVKRKSHCPAPDAAELGEVLKITPMHRILVSYGGKEICVQQGAYCSDYYKMIEVDGKTEAQARAAALIWLIENGVLSKKVEKKMLTKNHCDIL